MECPLWHMVDAEQQDEQHAGCRERNFGAGWVESLCEIFSFHKMSLAQLRLTSGCVHL